MASEFEKDGAWKADAKIAAGVDDLKDTHPLNCTEDGTLEVEIVGTAVPIDVLVNGIVPVSQSGTWTVNLAAEPTIDIGKVQIEDTAGNSLTSTSGSLNVDVTNTVPVTGTFFQNTQPISGTVTVANPGLTDTQLRATPVPISGTVSLSVESIEIGTVDQGTGGASAWLTHVDNFPASQAVTGTFWQSTQPVSIATMPSTPVTGTFWQATQPVSLASTTLTGTVAVTQSGTWDITSITNPVAVTGTFWQATQPVSGTLAVSNFPASQVVTLASTTITGSVAVTGAFYQATQPVSGTLSVSNFPASQVVTLASTTITGTVAATQSGTWTTGRTWNLLNTTDSVNVGNFPASQVVTGTFWQATQPVSGTFYQATQPISGTVTANQGTNPWVTSLASTTITGTVAVTQSTSPWVTSLASTTVTNTVAENLAQVAGVVLGATAVTAYGTAPAAANVPGVNAFITNVPHVINDASSAVIGHVITDSGSTTAVTGNVTVIQPTGTQLHTVIDSGTITTVSAVTAITNALPAGTNVIGHVITDTGSTTAVTGTVAVTQSTSPWVTSLASTTVTNTVAENLTQVAGVVLGATAVTAYGTAPAAANVPGVNAFITNTPAVTLTSTTLTGTSTVAGNLTNNNAAPAGTNLGVLSAIASLAAPSWTQGDLVLQSVDLLGNQRVKLNSANLGVTATGAAAAAVTLTLTGVAAQFHYITMLEIEAYSTAARTGGVTPVLVTSTNLPGNIVWTFASGTLAGSTDTKNYVPSNPFQSSAVNTNTTIVCPATTAIIWRVTAWYYTGA